MSKSSPLCRQWLSSYCVSHGQLTRNVRCKSLFNSILGSKPLFGFKWIELLNVLPWLAFVLYVGIFFPLNLITSSDVQILYFLINVIFLLLCGHHLPYNGEHILSVTFPPMTYCSALVLFYIQDGFGSF